MIAVILAAGVGSRLRPLTRHKPKCMVKVAGRTILDHQIDAYHSAGVREIIVVIGYESDVIRDHCKRIKDLDITLVDNVDYEITNNMYSLYLTKEYVEGRSFFLSNGDVVFDPSIIHDLVRSAVDDVVVVDSAHYYEESMKISVDADGNIDDISKSISGTKAFGSSIDVYRFSCHSSTTLFDEMSRLIVRDQNRKEWTEVALQNLYQQGRIKMRPFELMEGRWVEIDNYDDLGLADRYFATIDINEKNVFVIDLDGTMYIGNRLVEGAVDFISALRKRKKQFYFISNNSSGAKSDYILKLQDMGITINEENLVLSTDGLIEYLLNNRIRTVFVLGTRALETSISDAGLTLEQNGPEYVVVGYDTELTYEKLKNAAIALNNGAGLLATHPDMVCPTPDGPVPDIGALLVLLEAATGKKPERIFGKPNREIVAHLLDPYAINEAEVVVVGDRLYTDMVLARNIGCDFILVLSGETNREDVDDLADWPDLIVKNVGDIFES